MLQKVEKRAVEMEPAFQSIIRQEYEARVTENNLVANVICKTECSMVDTKMVSLLQGNSGAFCHLCDVTCAEANDVGLFKRGFIITKDFESTRRAWEQLTSGAIAYNDAERKGQCHPNLVQADLHCFSVLHFKLSCLDYAQKILYRLQCGQKDWREEGMPLRMMPIHNRARLQCIIFIIYISY